MNNLTSARDERIDPSLTFLSPLDSGGWEGDLGANVYVCLAGKQLPARAAAVWILARHQSKHVAVEAATSTVMYLLSNLCLGESPYILFKE